MKGRSRLAGFLRSVTWLPALPLVACAADVPAPQSSAGFPCAPSVPGSDLSGVSRVGVAPAVEIGVTSGEPAHLLYNVAAVRRLSDGRIVVANAGTNEIRVYDDEGKHLNTIGSAGRGPREFQNLSDLFVLAGDTLLVFDAYPGRIVKVSADGAFVWTRDVPRIGDGLHFERAVGVLGSALVLLGWIPPGDASFVGSSGSLRPDALLYAVDLETGEARHLLTVPAGELGYIRTERGVARMVMPYGKWTVLTARNDRLVVGDNAHPVIRVLGNAGEVLTAVQLAFDTLAVNDAALEIYVDDYLSDNPSTTSSQRREWEKAINDVPVPAVMPFFRSAVIDGSGRLWIEPFSVGKPDTTVFFVAGPGGHIAGCITLPTGLAGPREPMISGDRLEIGDDYLLGVWVDTLGVERVRLYQLDRAANGAPR